ncbi:hypothetical protein MP228_012380 [Amoeboaphelidium protococcarum]|nr:hypothetical protein MP228_012380 [Amoeboaphelidium protococcarum]
MQLLKLSSILTAAAVILARALPNEDPPVKCRLRDKVSDGVLSENCKHCPGNQIASSLSMFGVTQSTSCTSTASTPTTVFNQSGSNQVTSGMPCTTCSPIMVESSPCTSCQFTKTSNQDVTPAIPATETKIASSISSLVARQSSKADTTETVAKPATLSSIHSSDVKQTPSSIIASSGSGTPSSRTQAISSTLAQFRSSQEALTSTTVESSRSTVISTSSVSTTQAVKTPATWNPQQPQPPAPELPPSTPEPAPPRPPRQRNPNPDNPQSQFSSLTSTSRRPTQTPVVPESRLPRRPTQTPVEPESLLPRRPTQTPVEPESRLPRRPTQTPDVPESPLPRRRPETPVESPSAPTSRTPSDRRTRPANTPQPTPSRVRPPVPTPSPPPPQPAPEDPVPFECGESPLVFDLNQDWDVHVKYGTGIWLDPSNVTELHAGAVGGDMMLALPDVNGNGQIDIEEVFGNRLLSPFTKVSYKAANGFEALHKLAIEADSQPLCSVRSTNLKNKSVLVSLPKLKACLQLYGYDLGFISGDNVKVLQPLAQVDTVDVVDYLETPDDSLGGITHAQKGHYYDHSGVKWRVDDVWFMTGRSQSKDFI